MNRLALDLFAIGVLAPWVQADILHVGGGSYAQIADAVAAATDGDTILVESGAYQGFQVNGVSLHIAPADSGSVYSTGTITVSNLASSQTVVITLADQGASTVDSLSLTNCLGSVRLEGGEYLGHALGNSISNCSSVSIEGALFRSVPVSPTSRPGLTVLHSFVAIHSGAIFGANGAYGQLGGDNGSPGLSRGGTGQVFLSATIVQGGHGGDAATGLGGGWGGWGADGVQSPGANNVLGLGCTFAGGQSGLGLWTPPDGLPLNTGTALSGPGRSLQASPVGFDHSRVELTFRGLAGEQVEYAVSPGLQYAMGPEIGPLLLPNPQWIAAGAIPAGGTLVVTHENTDLPALDRSTLYFQGRMSGAGLSYLTNASRTLVLDRGLDDCTVQDVLLGKEYCSPNTPNSTGQPGRLNAVGSHCVSNNKVTLTASKLPMNEFGYVLNSTGLDQVVNPGGALGTLCLGGGHPMGRHNSPSEIRNSGVQGSFELDIDLTSMPGPGGQVTTVAGMGWAFQVWHRDGSVSRFTNAVAIAFH